jgi:hypothetical protein
MRKRSHQMRARQALKTNHRRAPKTHSRR